MEMYYTKNKLYVDINERVDFYLINKLQNRLYRIIEDYAINDIVLNIISNEHYDSVLLDEFINDYNSKYRGRLTIK